MNKLVGGGNDERSGGEDSAPSPVLGLYMFKCDFPKLLPPGILDAQKEFIEKTDVLPLGEGLQYRYQL